jgi:hypothetical protein
MIHPLIENFLGRIFRAAQQTKNKIDTSCLVGRSGKKRKTTRKRSAALRVSLQGERLSKRPLLRGSF